MRCPIFLFLSHYACHFFRAFPPVQLAALRACHEYVSKQWDAETREIIEIPDRLIYAPCAQSTPENPETPGSSLHQKVSPAV